LAFPEPEVPPWPLEKALAPVSAPVCGQALACLLAARPDFSHELAEADAQSHAAKGRENPHAPRRHSAFPARVHLSAVEHPAEPGPCLHKISRSLFYVWPTFGLSLFLLYVSKIHSFLKELSSRRLPYRRYPQGLEDSFSLHSSPFFGEAKLEQEIRRHGLFSDRIYRNNQDNQPKYAHDENPHRDWL
jgi:hypothetical protein